MSSLRSHLPLAVSLLALAVALSGTAIAATGGNFILGQSNKADQTTSLSTSIGGRSLRITNTSSEAGATALGLSVAPGKPPMTVSSSTRVKNLNADLLDGKHSTAFVARSDVMQMHASFIPVGGNPSWTLGKLTVSVTCPGASINVYVASTSSSASVAQLSGLASVDYIGPYVPNTSRRIISAGGSALILGYDMGLEANWDVSTLVWWDGTDTITATIATQIGTSGTCQLEGTLVRGH